MVNAQVPKTTMTKNKIETLDQIRIRLFQAAIEKATEETSIEAEKLWEKQNENARLKIEALAKELNVGGIKDLIEFIQSVYGIRSGKGKVSKKSEGKRTRTKITPEIRDKVKALNKQGKKAPTIAKELGISPPTVYNILNDK